MTELNDFHFGIRFDYDRVMKTIIKKMNTNYKALLMLCLITVGFANPLLAQEKPLHELHSMMIYNFIKYIQWPESNVQGEFTIAVIGDDQVYNTLNAWYGGKVRGNKKFIVKKFNTAEEVTSCEILYVSNESSNQFNTIKSKLASTSTLLITDKDGLAEKGSGINFKRINNKIAFELNQKAIESASLKVSGQLVNMAILI